MNTRLLCIPLAVFGVSIAGADIFAYQPPASGGGVPRWSKLWVDLSGQGNNLDGDAICYEDFVLSTPALVDHVEWWGDAQPDQGFQIEIWKQDPGTIGYQPDGVWREYGHNPEFSTVTTVYSHSIDPSGTTHYAFDLASPLNLAANDSTNPRWFLAVIGLTDVPYLEWNWAQGTGGSNRTFQFIRGGSLAGGDLYQILPEGRAFLLSGTPVPEPATIGVLA